jgi:hypothetical protein
MTIDENYPYLGEIFLYLINNPVFKELTKEWAPEMAEDIESAINNPNCGCRNRIKDYILKNKEKAYLFFRDFINTHPGAFDLNHFLFFIAPPKNYSGTIERVKRSEWLKFVEKLNFEKAKFRNFSVVKADEENIDVFFI